MKRLTRQGLGPCFSEGARLLWSAVQGAGGSQAATARLLGMTRGQASRLLYGERRPGRAMAETIRAQLGIDPGLWDAAPTEAFAPPAAVEAKAAKGKRARGPKKGDGEHAADNATA